MTYAHSRLSSDVCLFSICRTTYVCFRFVERRLWWDVIKLDETFHQTHCERLIKFDESDLSNLMNESVISSNLTKTIHQTWRKKRHLIKSNERVISSNFLKRETISLFFDEQFCSDIWCEELSLAEDHFLCEDKCLCETVMISERFFWKLNVDITHLFLLKEKL
jgi:hypothetical protein